MDVTFIGLGAMGVPIATNLLLPKEGQFYPLIKNLRVYNRTFEKVTDFKNSLPPEIAGNVFCARTIKEAVLVPDSIVVSIVSNDAALEDICSALLEVLGQGGIHLCLSTVSPAIADKMEIMNAEKGAFYISCPVFGRPSVAAVRKLIAVPGGNRMAYEKIKPLLELISQKIVYSGEKASSSNILKLSGNYMILAAIQMNAEAFALAESHGIDRMVAYDLLTGPDGIFQKIPLLATYGKMVASREYPIGFTAENGAKDCRLISEAAEQGCVHMPILDIVRERTENVIKESNDGGRDKDWSFFAELVKIGNENLN